MYLISGRLHLLNNFFIVRVRQSGLIGYPPGYAKTIMFSIYKHERIVEFIKELEQKEGLITEFDEWLWNGVIEKIEVNEGSDIVFIFKDGMEYKVNIK